MPGRVIQLSDYRDKRNHQRVQAALNQLYWGVLKTLQDETQRINPDDLEEFFVNAVADHLMSEFVSVSDVEALAEHYDSFDRNLRQAIYQRLLGITQY